MTAPKACLTRSGRPWPLAIVQTCVLHLIRNTFRLASRAGWDAMAKDLRPVYTAATEAAAKERFVEFCEAWVERYPAVRNLWEERLGRVRAVPRLQP